MSTRDEIRAAFVEHGPLTVSELATHCPACENDKQIVAASVGTLRTEGKVRGVGLDEGEPVYDIAVWPADGDEKLRVKGSAMQKPKPIAAEWAPDRAPTPVTTPSPARPAAQHQEESMREKKTVAERVVDALKKHGNQALEKLAKNADTTVQTLYTMMGTLKKKHGVTRVGKEGKASIYGFAGAARAEPSAPTKVKKERKKNVRTAPQRPEPARQPNGNGNGAAHFAINEHGELGIEIKDQKVKLDAETFERLRSFIERTKPVWASE